MFIMKITSDSKINISNFPNKVINRITKIRFSPNRKVANVWLTDNSDDLYKVINDDSIKTVIVRDGSILDLPVVFEYKRNDFWEGII